MASKMGNSGARKAFTKGQKVVASGDKARVTAQGYKGTADSKEALIDAVKNATEFFQFKYPVKVRIQHEGNVDKYIAVFWQWMRHITVELKKKWPDAYASLDSRGVKLHDMYCQMLLGRTNPYKAGKSLIEGSLITLTQPKKLDEGEMYDLLRRIEEHCISMGIFMPADRSEYTEAKKRENQ